MFNQNQGAKFEMWHNPESIPDYLAPERKCTANLLIRQPKPINQNVTLFLTEFANLKIRITN